MSVRWSCRLCGCSLFIFVEASCGECPLRCLVRLVGRPPESAPGSFDGRLLGGRPGVSLSVRSEGAFGVARTPGAWSPGSDLDERWCHRRQCLADVEGPEAGSGLGAGTDPLSGDLFRGPSGARSDSVRSIWVEFQRVLSPMTPLDMCSRMVAWEFTFTCFVM